MAPLSKQTLLGILLASLSQPGLALNANDKSFMDKPVSFGAPAAGAEPTPVPVAAAKPKPAPLPKAAPPISPAPLSPAAQAVAAPPVASNPAPAPAPAPSAASLPFKLEGQLFLRYDRQGDQALSYGAPGSSAPKAVMGQALGNTASANKGAVDALYVRRAELKLVSEPTTWSKLVLGWDLSENKLKDAGLEAKLGPAGRLQLGQFRQRFGIEQQTSSTKTHFAERALIYGGLHPFASGPSALVKERAMGLHGDWKPRGHWGGLDLGASLVNNTTEDQGAGQNKPASTGSFPSSINDHGPSYSLHAAADTKLPGLKRLLVGVSYQRDPQNSVPVPHDPSHEKVEELVGLEAALESGPVQLQAEWVSSQRSSGSGSAPNGVWKGVDRRREGWYATLCVDLLHPLFGADAPSVDLLLRDEAWVPVGAVNPTKFGAWTGGLRFKNGRHWQSALNVTVYDINGDSGALGGSELWVFQQVLTF